MCCCVCPTLFCDQLLPELSVRCSYGCWGGQLFLADRCAYDNTPGAKVLKTFKFLATGPWFGLLSSVANALGSMSPSCWHMLRRWLSQRLMVDKTLWSNLASTHENWARQLCRLGSRRGPGSHPSAKFRAPGPWQRLRIHGVTHGVMLGQQRGRERVDIVAKQSRTHGMTHALSKAPVLMTHGLTCRVGWAEQNCSNSMPPGPALQCSAIM